MWQLENHLAAWSGPRAQFQIQLDRPALGIAQLNLDGDSVSATLRPLQPQWWSDATLEDSYIRGSDLVATFRESPRHHVRPQLYWRVLDTGRSEIALAVELIVSVQTSRLDSRPQLQLETSCAASRILDLTDGAVGEYALSESDSGEPDGLAGRASAGPATLPPTTVRVARPEGRAWSYVELVHPSDYVSNRSPEASGDDRIKTSLFAERLEKGVIRRARIRGLCVDRQDDLATARQQYLDFAASPPPLTV